MKTLSDEPRLDLSLRELVALAARAGAEGAGAPRRVVECVAELLERLLGLELVYVRVPGGPGEGTLEVARTAGQPAAAAQAAAIGGVLAPWVEGTDDSPLVTLPHPAGGGTVRLVLLPIGGEGEDGVIAAGAQRADFPTQSDRLVLTLGATQLASWRRLRAREAAARAEVAEWQRRYEEALQATGQLLAERNAQQQLAAIVESSADAILSLTFDGLILSWNPGAERLYGYMAAEISQGRSVFQLVPPGGREELAAMLERVRQGGRVEGVETVGQRKDGKRVAVALTLSPVRNAAGQLIGASLIARDISARKEAEAALRRAEAAERAQRQYFETTLASIGDAVIVTDAAGRVTFLNPVAQTLTGWTADEARGRPLAEIFHIVNEETRRPVDNPVEKVLLEDVVAGLANHTVLLARDGTEYPIDDSAAPIRDAQGQLLGVVLVFRDITERRRAEAALRESEQRWRTLAETLPALVWVARPDAFVEYCNQRWSDYTGLPAEQLTGWGWQAVWHPDDVPAGRTRWLEAVRTGQPYEYEARLRRADGSFRWHLIRAVPLQDSDGQGRRWLGTMVDIEEQKRSAAELRRSNAELQQFAYVASHDLQEPLRMVSLYVELLAKRYRGQLDTEAEEFIGYAVEGAQRMKALIDDLLAYSRVETQGRPLGPTDCTAVLQQVLHNLQPVIAETQAVITADPLPTVWADALQLGQVLQNLLSNALKFRGETPPQVHVSARRAGSEWVMAVRDNGIGIDPRHAARLFQMFQRLHARDKYPGTGIGLA
ncbi:MAG: PAS domain S-box protein, partial [Thermodesulfobacteriota bacterium]